MTTLHANTARLDFVFASVVAFCADFCAGARQGGYPQSPPNRPDGPAPLKFVR